MLLPFFILKYKIDEHEWQKTNDLNETENYKPSHKVKKVVNSLALRGLNNFHFFFQGSQFVKYRIDEVDNVVIPLFFGL